MLNLFGGCGRSSMVDRKVQQKFRIVPVRPMEPRRHYLAAASVVRNEARHIREWIEFHRIVGFEHFTIYDNSSTDGTRKILAPYVREGLVEIVPWPHFLRDHDTQAMAWSHALGHAGPQTQWLAFFDIDEYMYPRGADRLCDILAMYEDLPAVVVYWLMFGTSGHVEPVRGLMIEEFTQRAPVPESALKDPTLANYKSVVQPHHIIGVRGSHNFVTDINECNGFDEARRQIRRKNPRRVTVERLRINHYYTRSLTEWQARFGRLQVSNTVKREAFLKSAFEKIESAPVEDLEIQRYLPRLREALARPAENG